MLGGFKKKQFIADVLLLMVVAIWGTTFPIMKIILVDIDPFYFIGLRFLIAFIFLYVIFKRKLKSVTWVRLKKGLILGNWLFAGYSFQIVGLQFTTASRSGFITGLSVVLVPLFVVLLLGEKPGVFNLMGIILATGGLFFLTEIGEKGISPGDFLTILCAISFAMQIVLLSKYVKGEDPVALTLIQLGVVSLGAFIVSIFRSGFILVGIQAGGVIIYTGLMATALAYLIQSYAQQFTSPIHAGLIFTMEPVFAAFFAFIILGETLNRGVILGGALIIAGMITAEMGQNIFEKRRNKISD